MTDSTKRRSEMDTKTKTEVLEQEYRRRVAEVRSDNSHLWEKQERKVRELGLEYDRALKQLQEAA
jgi:hypothetical protein